MHRQIGTSKVIESISIPSIYSINAINPSLLEYITRPVHAPLHPEIAQVLMHEELYSPNVPGKIGATLPWILFLTDKDKVQEQTITL